MKIETPEFNDWKDEASFWDLTDTALAMEEENGEWVGPGRVKSAPDLCRRCGARMKRRRMDISIARGRVILHEAEFYVCSRCGNRALPPTRQEFVTWSQVSSDPSTAPA